MPVDASNLSFSDSSNTPSPDDSALVEATSLANKARQLDGRGCYHEAEQLLHQALGLVDPHLSSSSTTLVKIWNTLGELYVHMGRLQDAEQWFNKSLDAGVTIRDLDNITISRENLARVQRIKGATLKAKALKMLGASDNMSCGSSECAQGLLRSPDFCICGGCKREFYCSITCQREDWEWHKRRCHT